MDGPGNGWADEESNSRGADKTEATTCGNDEQQCADSARGRMSWVRARRLCVGTSSTARHSFRGLAGNSEG